MRSSFAAPAGLLGWFVIAWSLPCFGQERAALDAGVALDAAAASHEQPGADTGAWAPGGDAESAVDERGDGSVVDGVVYRESDVPPGSATTDDVLATGLGAAPGAAGTVPGLASTSGSASAAPAPLAVDAVAAPVDVTVRGASVAKRMEQSSQSVQVVDLTAGRQQSADLGELLARTQGVSVRRAGGLGSSERIAIQGFGDAQVPVFVDGVPMGYTGFGGGLSSLPVNLLERVEIYRGVVPIRFGADALGGAINVVTRTPSRGLGGNVSLELGSFGTERAALLAHHLHAPSGFLTRGSLFFDHAKNDYPVRVTIGSADGGSSSATAYRTHDGYRSYGGGIDLGFVRRRWAERLLLKGFASTYDKDLQSNLVMTIPYGEARYGGQSYGASLEYAQPLGDRARVDAVLGYGYQKTDFEDLSEWRYDWFGQRQRKLRKPGEIGSNGPIDQQTWQHGVFARANLSWELGWGQTLRANVSPSLTARSGGDAATKPGKRDPLAADKHLVVLVSGLEHVLVLFDERLENSLFGKSYFYQADASEPLAMGLTRSRDRKLHRFGVGDGLRFRFSPWAYAKVAYELATRLPAPDEVFGDGRRTKANLELRPEHSHNTNLTLALDALATDFGQFTFEVHVFDRRARDLITRMLEGEVASYQNIGRVRSVGAELVGGYRASQYLSIDGNMTYQSLRNESKDGEFARYDGQRIPNRPYLFANASARGALPEAIVARDELSLTYYLRYVHGFYRAWGSDGSGAYAEYKESVAAQLSHTLALSYLLRSGARSYSMSIDVQNLTDAPLFDEFGAQRPGRGYYFKLTGDY